MVPILTIVIIIFNALLVTAIPITLMIILRKKYHASLAAFFIGCAVWFVFAMILEQIMHTMVLYVLPIGKTIQDNIYLMALYGGIAAAVFEECGRYVAMRFVLKKHHENSHNAIMYGAGHGGFEAFFLLGTAMVNNLIYAVMINTGQTSQLLEPLDEANRTALQQAFTELSQSSPFLFLVAPIERIIAIALHISLSVLVWAAVVKGRKYLFPLAVFLHFAVDAIAVLASGLGVPIVLIELIMFVFTLICALYARRVMIKEVISDEGRNEN